MRKFAALCLLLPSAVWADLNVFCDDCRTGVPTDYGNFAYNQVFGTDRWINWDAGDRFSVTNGAGETFRVDLDFEVEATTFGLGLGKCVYGFCFNIQIPNYSGDVRVSVRRLNGMEIASYNLELKPADYPVGEDFAAGDPDPDAAAVALSDAQLAAIERVNQALAIGWGYHAATRSWTLTGYGGLPTGTPVVTIVECAWHDGC